MEVAEIARRAREDGRLGIDTEFVPEGRYRPLLCLVQVVVGEDITLLDPLAGGGFDPAPLAEVLADPAVEIVLHAGRQDVSIMRREWNTDVTNVFDTQVSAGFAGFPAQAGYLNLLGEALGIRLKKSASFTRWDRRPLTEEQLRYAAEDVEHLFALTDHIKAKLEAKGRLEWAAEECRAIADSSDERDPDEVWRRLPRTSGMSPAERAVARELAAWRERTAEQEDKPLGSIVRDPALVELAKRRPRSAKEIANLRGITPDVVRKRSEAILAAIERGLEAEPIRLEETDRVATDAVDGPVVALVESLVRARARDAGLAYELIAARADLAPIVAHARRGRPEPDVRTLHGWRRELVGNEVLDLLAGNVALGVEDAKVVITPRTTERR